MQYRQTTEKDQNKIPHNTVRKNISKEVKDIKKIIQGIKKYYISELENSEIKQN